MLSFISCYPKKKDITLTFPFQWVPVTILRFISFMILVVITIFISNSCLIQYIDSSPVTSNILSVVFYTSDTPVIDNMFFSDVYWIAWKLLTILSTVAIVIITHMWILQRVYVCLAIHHDKESYNEQYLEQHHAGILNIWEKWVTECTLSMYYSAYTKLYNHTLHKGKIAASLTVLNKILRITLYPWILILGVSLYVLHQKDVLALQLIEDASKEITNISSYTEYYKDTDTVAMHILEDLSTAKKAHPSDKYVYLPCERRFTSLQQYKTILRVVSPVHTAPTPQLKQEQ